MKASMENLKKLEIKINKAYGRCRNTEYFFESKRGSRYAEQWEQMITELRGWGEYRWDDGKDLMKESWVIACGTQLSPSYNLGDVCA